MAYPLFSLEGRLALVTGSATGIGYALAKGMAEHGAAIVVNARSAAKVEEATATLAAAGRKVHGAVFDVTDYASVEAEVERIEKMSAPIDILVNNAGIQHRAPLEDFPEEKWQQLMQTNISSIFHVGKAVARQMIPRGRGKIINIASVQSELARPASRPTRQPRAR